MRRHRHADGAERERRGEVRPVLAGADERVGLLRQRQGPRHRAELQLPGPQHHPSHCFCAKRCK